MTMEKSVNANSYPKSKLQPADVASAIGMAALFMALYKRLIYPVIFVYYRTGNESALSAQGVYAIALLVVVLALVVQHGYLARMLLRHRWIAATTGIAGAAGTALLTPQLSSVVDGEISLMVGSALVALFFATHVVFWLVHLLAHYGENNAERARAARNSLLSAAILFVVCAAILAAAGWQTPVVSIACPAISGVAALFCKPAAIAGERTSGEPIPSAGASSESIPSGDTPSEGVSSRDTPSKGAPIAQTADGLDLSEITQFADDFDLSDREAELAAYTYRNYSARKIAKELFIAESTVYTHQKRIYRKTGVHSKHELIELIDQWKADVRSNASTE